MAPIRRLLLRLLSFLSVDRAETDLAREIDAHLRLLEDGFVAQGMSPQDARYAAKRAFGGVEQVKEHQRDARSFRWLDSSWLDVKLGFRMLVKYPGLTLVGGFAMAFAIAVGAGGFEVLTQMVRPTLPLDDGERIVGILQVDTAAGGGEDRILHDFESWRQELDSVHELGAFTTLDRNLITDDGRGEPVELAEISASAFRLARVPPLLGRALHESDEQPGARPVAVIGYDVWQTRFGADPGVVGRLVRLGHEHRAVVGVMPKGFAFPVAHGIWTPLRPNVLEHERRQGPRIRIFGRLADGFTLEEAQAELTAIGSRAAADFPATHAHLRPRVLPYAQAISGLSTAESVALRSINIVLVMLLVLVCANVALLMFARAATRENEILVRTALGASRGRIIMQLFAEALVLGSVAAVAGLAAAGFLLRWWLGVSAIEAGGRLPFWFNDRLAPATVLYAGLLTVLGALIAGVVPALKVTGRRVEARLRQASAGGGGLRFGGVWTVVIVSQVAATVAFPATAFFVRQSVVQIRSLDPGFPANEYLSVRLEMDRETPVSASGARGTDAFPAGHTTLGELKRRLADEPPVAGVTFVDRLPRTQHSSRRIELDEREGGPPESVEPRVSSAFVGAEYFEVLGAPILAGRGFHSGDAGADRRAIVVNQSFVDRVLGGRNPIGRRVRYLRQRGDDGIARDAAPGPWHEVVGVVRDLGMIADDPADGAGIYHPVLPGAAFPIHMVVHVKGDPRSFAPRLGALATAVDPTLRLHDPLPLDQVGQTMWLEFNFLYRLLVLVSSIALLLSLAGIFSVMSFTVSQRTREIGIRVALGAEARQIVAATFRGPLVQVGLGVAAGGGLAAALAVAVSGGLSLRGTALVLAYAALMTAVCMLGCVAPARRALRIQPTEALKEQ